MLSPRYLDGLSDDLVEIYSRLETDILQDMARRISRLGKITDATKWQAQMLAEVGGLKRNISRILAKYDKTIVEQVKKAFSDALETNAKNDNRIFKEATGRTVSTPNAQAMLSTIQKCHSDLSRLTLTTASTTQEQFVREANRVYMNVQSGAFDYDTAMKDAANSLAKRGITTVQYENGKPVIRTIESAVRMNILTSINQTAANQTLNNCEELECDLVETSAHVGSRPEHEEWQGQIFSMSGTNKKYRPFSVCELGSATGICGINCRHSFYPYFEGTQKHYTQDDLDEMASEKVKFNGKEMTRYEGEQKLRGIERNIRAYKRQAVTQEAAGVDNTKARAKLGEWQAVARDFTKQTGIQRDFAREYIGTGGNRQPRGMKPTVKFATETTQTSTNTSKTILETAKETDEKIKILVDNPKSSIRQSLEDSNVFSREVFVFEKPQSEIEIIKRIAGSDKTEGSCASLAYSYVANKANFNVLDFRDGKSREIFSHSATLREIADFNGVISKVVKEYNDFKAFKLISEEIKSSKEYILGIGKHCAIVRKTENNVLEYLELQTEEDNGFKPFIANTLKRRFGCQQSYSTYGTKYQVTSVLVDIESLGKNKEFIELMKYINTEANAQRKGLGGYAK